MCINIDTCQQRFITISVKKSLCFSPNYKCRNHRDFFHQIISIRYNVGCHTNTKDKVNSQNFQINPEYMTGILVAIYADEDISENLDESKTL